MAEEQTNTTIKSRWSKLESSRTSVLDRARQCTALTIPSLLPPDGSDESTSLDTPYQSLGARATNNLASKLLLSLLPPNTPFFRLTVDEEALVELGDQRTQIEQDLASVESDVASGVERQALRLPVFEALKLLVATGNALVYKRPKAGGMRVFRLDQYVVKRDPIGNPLEIIVKESVAIKALPEEMLSVLKEDTKENVELYTIVVRVDKNTFETYQEVGDIEVPGSRGTYKAKEMPWMPLRWTAINGEDYGRGLVEHYLGDLITLESLNQIIVEAAAASSKVVFLVDPNGSTHPDDVGKAKTGDFVPGRRKDIETLQAEKQADLQLAYNLMQEITQRLSQAFLLNTSVTRNAERVTASEINYMAKELEDALGGIYTVLSNEFQRPLVSLLLKESGIALPDGIVEPVIVTGLEALGRGHDYDKLVMFGQTLQQMFGGEIIAQYANVDAIISQLGTSLGIETNGIIKTSEQMQQEAQQAQQQALLSQGGQAFAQEAGAGAGRNVTGQNPNQKESQ